MNGNPLPAIVVAIEISDPAMADRLRSLFARVAGIRLAAPREKKQR